MAEVKTNNNAADLMVDLAEGRLGTTKFVQVPHQKPTFIKMIVLEVVSDPNTTTLNTPPEAWSQRLGVSNSFLASALPRNTIVAKEVSSDSQPMFLFPFFPSHISLPCKIGECVWAMFDNPSSNNPQIGYWFCRVVDIHSSDDVNHSHPGRSLEPTLYPTAKELSDAEKEGTATTGEYAWHELRNGPIANLITDKDTSRVTAKPYILRGVPEDIFEFLITASETSLYTLYEAVPRFRKRPGDLVLEGSNNSLICLGADRNTGTLLKTSVVGESGAIDLVTGRGCTPETLGIETDTTSIKDAKGKTKGTPLKKELNKSPSVLSPVEGDPDYTNDRSRILVSQRTNPDTKFGLVDYNSKTGFSADAPDGDAAIVIKTDKVRMIARSDLELVVTNYSMTEINGRQPRKDEEADLEKWAAIMIKANGDIIIKPSKLGYVKLGGEDADKGIVCSDQPVTATDGNISGPSLVTTMGGFFAGSAAAEGDNKAILAVGQAKFANKVLIK